MIVNQMSHARPPGLPNPSTVLLQKQHHWDPKKTHDPDVRGETRGLQTVADTCIDEPPSACLQSP